MKSFLNKRIAGNQLTQEEAYAALSIPHKLLHF
jgi:hypothetical protein